MFTRFLRLEIKHFFRGSSAGINLLMKILRIFGIVYFMLVFAALAFLAFFYIREEMAQDPLKLVGKYTIIAWVTDLLLKYTLQQIPAQNIKPFLTQNIPKKFVVRYTVLKTFLSPFSWLHSIFYLTFTGILLYQGYGFVPVLAWIISVSLLFYLNNFLNLLFNDRENVAIGIGILIAVFAALEYYQRAPVLDTFEQIFYAFYSQPYLVLLPVIVFFMLWYFTQRFIQHKFYLDEGLEEKKAAGKTENIAFLNQFGAIGTFINNDIKMLRRNKVTKNVLVGSLMFVFYGLLMFTNKYYSTPAALMFMGLFVTGGFQFNFGQRVPSFDSAYYPLMMTQNVPYKEYIKAKWWLMNVMTAVSIVVALFYVYFGWHIYFAFFAAGLYNIGINSQLTLYAGAFNKSQIDLNEREKKVGQKNAYNLKTLLLMIPNMLLPMAVYGVAVYFHSVTAGVISIAILGVIGFLFREKLFDIIIKKYKSEKYSTLEAFKKN